MRDLLEWSCSSVAFSVDERAKYSRRSSSVKRGRSYRAWISSSLKILSRFCVVLVVCSGKVHPPLNRSPTPIDAWQKVDLLHHTRCRVPLYVSLADCQIV